MIIDIYSFKSVFLQFCKYTDYVCQISLLLDVFKSVNDSIVIFTGCWIATNLAEIYCNASNLQPFSLVHRSGRYLLGGEYLEQG